MLFVSLLFHTCSCSPLGPASLFRVHVISVPRRHTRSPFNIAVPFCSVKIIAKHCSQKPFLLQTGFLQTVSFPKSKPIFSNRFTLKTALSGQKIFEKTHNPNQSPRMSSSRIFFSHFLFSFFYPSALLLFNSSVFLFYFSRLWLFFLFCLFANLILPLRAARAYRENPPRLFTTSLPESPVFS